MEKEKKISLIRAKVLTKIKEKEPVAIHELVDELEFPRSTIVSNIDKLKLRELVLEKTSEEITGEKQLGSSVYLKTNKANPMLKKTIAISDAVINFFK